MADMAILGDDCGFTNSGTAPNAAWTFRGILSCNTCISELSLVQPVGYEDRSFSKSLDESHRQTLIKPGDHLLPDISHGVVRDY